MLQRVLLRLRALFRRNAVDREMSEEMRDHLQRLTDANLAAGLDPDEARRRAEQRFGHMEGFKEQCREQRHFAWLDELLQDVRYGARMFRKHPGFTLITILTLAVGIGATTTIFSIVNSVVLRPLPYPESGRLAMALDSQLPKFPRLPVANKSFVEWRKLATTIQGAAMYHSNPFVLTGAGEPARKFAFAVSGEFFGVMGVQPILGRTLTPADMEPGRDDVTVLNYKFWVSQFNSDPDIVGRKVLVDEKPMTVVGVMPPSFYPETLTDPWMFIPMAFNPRDLENYNARYNNTIVRLKPDVTLEQAAGELNVIEQQLAAQFRDGKTTGITLTPLIETRVGRVRPLLYTLLGAVGLLLLIACVNVANLLLARASSRQREIAVRTALGAGRGRLVRQLLCESVMLALLGSALGAVLAYVSKDFLLTFGPLDLPRSKEIAVDGTALAFSCLLGAFTGMGFGLVPALRTTRVDLPEVMRDGGRGSTEGGRRIGLRGILVVTEVGLALVLLISTGLMIRSFARMQRVELGFDGGVGVTHSSSLILPPSHYGTPERLVAFADRVTERIAAVPGVESAALTTGIPDLGWRQRIIEIEGRSDLKMADLPPSSYYTTTPGYFDLLRIHLRQGRLYDSHDRSTTQPVAVVSESFARKFFPNANPLGQHIRPSWGNYASTAPWREIIGVVADVREDGPVRSTSKLQVYEPYAQQPVGFVSLIFRIEHPMAGLRPMVRRALDEVDPNLPLTSMNESLDIFLRDATSTQRFTLFLVGVFSVVALLLSALGIYGVVSYSVAQRTPEIGIRMALGAQRGDILGMILLQTGRMILLGLLVGIAGAMASTRLLASMLFEVSTVDPVTFAAVPLILALIALLACWFPARRATKVNPLVALRHE